MSHRYFIYMAYDGTAYHGWQIQPNGISVQECLQQALSTLLRRNVEVVGAGRTELAEVIFGAKAKTAGKIFLNGQEIPFHTVSEDNVFYHTVCDSLYW